MQVTHLPSSRAFFQNQRLQNTTTTNIINPYCAVMDDDNVFSTTNNPIHHPFPSAVVRSCSLPRVFITSLPIPLFQILLAHIHLVLTPTLPFPLQLRIISTVFCHINDYLIPQMFRPPRAFLSNFLTVVIVPFRRAVHYKSSNFQLFH